MNTQRLVKLGIATLAVFVVLSAAFRYGPLDLKTFADALNDNKSTKLQPISSTDNDRCVSCQGTLNLNPFDGLLTTVIKVKEEASTVRTVGNITATTNEHLKMILAIPKLVQQAATQVDQFLVKLNDPIKLSELIVAEVKERNLSGARFIVPGHGMMMAHDPRLVDTLRNQSLTTQHELLKELIKTPVGSNPVFNVSYQGSTPTQTLAVNVFSQWLAAEKNRQQVEESLNQLLAGTSSASDFAANLLRAVSVSQALQEVTRQSVTKFAEATYSYFHALEQLPKLTTASLESKIPELSDMVIDILTTESLKTKLNFVTIADPLGSGVSEPALESDAGTSLTPAEAILIAGKAGLTDPEKLKVLLYSLGLDTPTYNAYSAIEKLKNNTEVVEALDLMAKYIDGDDLDDNQLQKLDNFIDKYTKGLQFNPEDFFLEESQRLNLWDQVVFSENFSSLFKQGVLNKNPLLAVVLAEAIKNGTLSALGTAEVLRVAHAEGIDVKKLTQTILALAEKTNVIRRAYGSGVTFDRSTGRLYYSGFVYRGKIENNKVVADKEKTPLAVISIDPFTGQYSGFADLKVVDPKLTGQLTVNPRTGDLILWYNLRPDDKSSTLSVNSKFSLDKVAVAADGSIGGEIKAFGKTLRYNPVTRAPEVPIRIKAKDVLTGTATIYIDAKGNVTGEIPFKVSGTEFGLYLDRGGNIAIGTEILAGGNQIGAVAITSQGVVTGSVDVLKLADVQSPVGLQLVFSTKGGFQGVNVPFGNFGVFVDKKGNLGFSGFIPIGPIPVPVGLTFNDRGEPILRFPGGSSNVGRWPVIGTVFTNTVGKLFGSSSDNRPRSKPPANMKDDGTVNLAVRFYPSKVRKPLGSYSVWNEFNMTPEQQKARAELIHDIYKTTLGRPPTNEEFLENYLYFNEDEAASTTRPHWTNVLISSHAEELKQVQESGGAEAAWSRHVEEERRRAIEGNPIGAILGEAGRTADPSLLDESALEGVVAGQVETTTSPTPSQPPRLPSDNLVVFRDKPPGEQVDAPTPIPSQTTQPGNTSVSLVLKRGWNLVTIPLKLRVSGSGTIPFAGFEAVRSLSSISGYYDSATELPESGEAFWVFSSQDTTRSLTGVIPLAEPLASSIVTVRLAKGWNIVGNPYNRPMPLKDTSFTIVTGSERVTLSRSLERKFISPVFTYDTTLNTWSKRNVGEELARNQSFAIQSGGDVLLELNGR